MPVRRWYAGQAAIDQECAGRARTIVNRRRKVEERVKRMLEDALEQGFLLAQNPDENAHADESTVDNTGAVYSPDRQDNPTRDDEINGGAAKPKRKPMVRVASSATGLSVHSISSSVRIDEFRRYGPLDLSEEHPPPSAIAGRRDTVGIDWIYLHYN
jgi:hypothetical protein